MTPAADAGRGAVAWAPSSPGRARAASPTPARRRPRVTARSSFARLARVAVRVAVRAAACAAVAGIAAACGAPEVRAQDAPLSLVDDETQVGTVGFRFVDTQTLDPVQLRLQLATTQPPLLQRFALTRTLLGGSGVFPFLPVEVAKDAIRLERYYADNGFPRVAVDYEARLDSARNRASVTFVIAEGAPLLVREVSFGGPGQRSVEDELEPELRAEWAVYAATPTLASGETVLAPGDRLDDFSLTELETATVRWLRRRGYAFADAGAERFLDSTGLRADVRLKVNAGPRARYGPIEVVGADGLAENVVLRELPFEAGDRFDGRDLSDGQRELFGLGLFQLALVETVPDQPRDSTVDVRVRLRRGPTRIASGFLGYFSDGGVTTRAQLTHRNAFGGARQASANVEWRTGIAGASGQAVSGGPIRDLRASVSLRQPYVFNRRVSATVQPAARVRDDEIEQSRSAELIGSLLYSRSSLRTAAASVTGRYVDLSRGQGLRLLDPLGRLNTTELTATTVVPAVDVVWGRLDDELQPRAGFSVRPSLSGAFGDIAYGRARLALSALSPLRERLGLAVRVTAGALAPMSGTSPDDGRDYVLLRDQLFYGGGTADVRGWATNRLGPKAFVVTTDSAGVVGDVRETLRGTLRGNGDINYVGTGGRAKLSASAQVNLPLPIGPQWGANVFLDAGQVFRPSTVPATLLLRQSGNPADLQLADILDAEGGLRVGAGAGLQYLTPIGFVSVALGVKLNPSYLDLRNAARVFCGPDGVVLTDTDGDGDTPDVGVCSGGYVGAREAGTTFDKDDIEPSRWFFGLFPQGGRIQLHLSIGQSF